MRLQLTLLGWSWGIILIKNRFDTHAKPGRNFGRRADKVVHHTLGLDVLCMGNLFDVGDRSHVLGFISPAHVFSGYIFS